MKNVLGPVQGIWTPPIKASQILWFYCPSDAKPCCWAVSEPAWPGALGKGPKLENGKIWGEIQPVYAAPPLQEQSIEFQS